MIVADFSNGFIGGKKIVSAGFQELIFNNNAGIFDKYFLTKVIKTISIHIQQRGIFLYRLFFLNILLEHLLELQHVYIFSYKLPFKS